MLKGRIMSSLTVCHAIFEKIHAATYSVVYGMLLVLLMFYYEVGHGKFLLFGSAIPFV